MAGYTKEQRAAKAAALAAEHPQAQDAPVAKPEPVVAVLLDPMLVNMTKDGETLSVHSTCVKAHLDVGWTVAG